MISYTVLCCLVVGLGYRLVFGCLVPSC